MRRNVRVEIVVAVDETGGFGKDGTIPWTLPEDLEHFKQLTTGHVCIMGRRTFNDLLDSRVKRDAARGINEPIVEILRGRESYVVTRDTNYKTPGATRVDGLGVVMDRMGNSRDPRTLFVIGGYKMFIDALSWANTVRMTIVKGESYDCDVRFPIEVLNKKFAIISGKQTDKAYYVVYQRQ